MIVVYLALAAFPILVVAMLFRHYARTFGADVPAGVRALLHARGFDLRAIPDYADVGGVAMKWMTAAAATPEGKVMTTVLYARRPGTVLRDAIVFRSGAIAPALDGLTEVPLSSGPFRDQPIRAYAAAPDELASWMDGALAILREPGVVSVRADEGALRVMAIPPVSDAGRADELVGRLRGFASAKAPALAPIGDVRPPANGFRIALASVGVACVLAFSGAMLLPAVTHAFDRVVCDEGSPTWWERPPENTPRRGTVGGWGCETSAGMVEGRAGLLGLSLFDPLLVLTAGALFAARPRAVRTG